VNGRCDPPGTRTERADATLLQIHNPALVRTRRREVRHYGRIQHGAAKRAGLPILRFHDLRHSFGTQAIRAFNIYEVQRMMGHRHITTTERYLHYAPDPDAAAKLSGLWQSDDPAGNVVSLRSAAA
jgi:integrase